MTDTLTTLFPLIFDAINDGVFTVDDDFRITSFNAAAENIVGISREQAIGRKCHEVFRASICQQGCVMRRTLEDEKPARDIQIDILNIKMEGVPILVSTAVLKDTNGRLVGGVEVFRDVSDVESLRNELNGKHRFKEIVGKSDAMKDVFALIPQVAETNASVFIGGESGTGKELVAQAIHDLSPRKDKPFIRVNCGALPDSLLESELFGYARGAFTGANHNKPGRFQQADGGTLFLDEVGDISPASQVKLLRALEEGEIQPLGSTKTVRVDVRLVTATNRNLPHLVNEEKFRDDLYYRIKVIPIEMPRLADRRKDIPLLVQHFLKALAARTGKPKPTISGAAMRALYDYDYPGNVRELKNVMERAFILCSSNTIELKNLPIEISHSGSSRSQGTVARRTRPSDEKIARMGARSSRRREGVPAKQRLLSILETHGWNRTAVAKDLGIGRTTLWRRMKELGLT